MNIILDIIQIFGIILLIANFVMLELFIIITVIFLMVNVYECGIKSVKNNINYRVYVTILGIIALDIDIIIRIFDLFKIDSSKYLPSFIKWRNKILNIIDDLSKNIIQDGRTNANATIKIKKDLKHLKRNTYTREIYMEVSISICGHSIDSIKELKNCTVIPTNLKEVWCTLYIYNEILYCDLIGKSDIILTHKPIIVSYNSGKENNLISFFNLRGKILCNVQEVYNILEKKLNS